MSNPDSPHRRLGPALRRWRHLNRIKQTTFAADFGVSQATVSRWEAGQLPDARQAERLTKLLSARLSGGGDRALRDLVTGSAEPYFLVCDLTHTLLAASPLRAKEWHVPVEDLIDRSLWPYASPCVQAFEGKLEEQGWFDPVAPDLVFRTEFWTCDTLSIMDGARRLARLQLSDGRHVRLLTDHADGTVTGLS